MRVSRYPQGYLELLGVKSQGTTPPDVSDVVSPVVDMTEFYAQGASTYAFGSTAVGVNATGAWGASTPLIVPSGELWRVHSITATAAAVLGAGTTIRVRALAYDPGRPLYIVGPTDASGVATDRPGITWDFTKPRIFTPGWSFGLWCDAVTLGIAPIFNFVLDFDRLT